MNIDFLLVVGMTIGFGVLLFCISVVVLMEIVIYGEPVPQGRPKFASFGGHVHAYDPAKSKNYKQLVRFWVTQHLKK